MKKALISVNLVKFKRVILEAEAFDSKLNKQIYLSNKKLKVIALLSKCESIAY